MSKVILIHGLPGSGKTTLAKMVSSALGAIHINADWARQTITSHLGFSEEDRNKQAKALASVARMVLEQGSWVVVDFVCPTPQTRASFCEVFKSPHEEIYSVWMNTIEAGRFEDTNKLYKAPSDAYVDFMVKGYKNEHELRSIAHQVVNLVTTGHKSYYIRYNTHNTGTLRWRIIQESTMEETLVDEFDLRGHMVPGRTFEGPVEKWNVKVTGYGAVSIDSDGRSTFTLRY